MSFLKDVDEIDGVTKDSVNGFSREIRSTLPDEVYYDIPALVSYMCLLYFYMKELFDAEYIHPSFALSEDKETLKKKAQEYGNVYLTPIAVTGVYKWKFKHTKWMAFI